VADDVRPVRRRRPTWKARFLELIRTTGNVHLAAEGAGVSRAAPYAAAARDAKFAAAWATAEEDAVDVLEAAARKRALTVSDSLLICLLKAHRPEKYRETIDVRVEFRREAERVAERLGVPLQEVLDRVEWRIRELG
jgi:NRPS condensation-like uncharacterized protein